MPQPEGYIYSAANMTTDQKLLLISTGAKYSRWMVSVILSSPEYDLLLDIHNIRVTLIKAAETHAVSAAFFSYLM